MEATNNVSVPAQGTPLYMLNEDSLRALIDAVVGKALDAAVSASQENIHLNKEMYLSIDETAELLGVARTTLWHWKKRGYLIPIQIGRKNLYLRKDVDRVLTNGKKG